MIRRVLVALSLAAALSTACTVLPQFEFDKANALVVESNKLNVDATSLLNEALAKYDSVYSAAQKADDPFEELGAQSEAFKKLEPQIDSAKSKLSEASRQLEDAAKLNLPDWYKTYLTNLSLWNKTGSESADLILQTVKNTYDPSIESPEDLAAKQKVLQDKLIATTKRKDELRAANDKIRDEHKDEFK
jgi:hypothetical protein